MKVKYVINNYILGSYFRCCPTDKVIKKERIDRYHTEVVFDINKYQKEFCDKSLARKGVILEEVEA